MTIEGLFKIVNIFFRGKLITSFQHVLIALAFAFQVENIGS